MEICCDDDVDDIFPVLSFGGPGALGVPPPVICVEFEFEFVENIPLDELFDDNEFELDILLEFELLLFDPIILCPSELLFVSVVLILIHVKLEHGV